MKFQIISFVAALALIAPVLGMPDDDKHSQQCHPHKYECPKYYICCPDPYDHYKYYCYKGHKCPHKY